jgi:hypothetical protein
MEIWIRDPEGTSRIRNTSHTVSEPLDGNTGHFSTLFSLLDSPFPAVAETALAAISATTGNSDCVSDIASSGGRCHQL